MYKIFKSLKRIRPNNLDRIFPIAKQEFSEFAKNLLHKKIINKYELDEKNGIKLTLYRNPDNKEVFIKIDQGGEVFSCVFDHAYVYVTTHYEIEHKLEGVKDLLTMAENWMKEKDYYEEIFEVGENVVFRKIIFQDKTSLSESTVFLGRFLKFFSRKRIVHPEF